MFMDIKNKVVIITGSSSGIGKATAIKFAEGGARIIVNCKEDIAGAKEVLEEIKGRGEKATFIQADIADHAQVEKLFKETLRTFGQVDILINNAGLARQKPFLELTRDDLIKDFEENFFSCVYCSQEAAKVMLKKGSGKIINVSSICGMAACTTVLPFSAAKAAMINFTRGLAKILAPKIAVNAVAPGFTLTRYWDGISKKEEKDLLATTLGKRWVTPDEIAETILYLTKNDGITGQVIIVDAGYTVTT